MRLATKSRHLWPVLVSAAVIFPSSTAPSGAADGITTTIAIQGDAVPDGNGLFAQFNTPVLNESGQVAFNATLINTSDGPDDARGIFRGSGGPITQIAREFQVPGFGLTILDEIPAMNNQGQVVFRAMQADLFNPLAERIFLAAAP